MDYNIVTSLKMSELSLHNQCVELDCFLVWIKASGIRLEPRQTKDPVVVQSRFQTQSACIFVFVTINGSLHSELLIFTGGQNQVREVVLILTIINVLFILVLLSIYTLNYRVKHSRRHTKITSGGRKNGIKWSVTNNFPYLITCEISLPEMIFMWNDRNDDIVIVNVKTSTTTVDVERSVT